MGVRNLSCGGLRVNSFEAKRHDKLYYEEIRKRRNDFLIIAKNTGFSIEQVQSIKYYIFYSRHYLEGNWAISERFYPSYKMAESWRRLSSKNKLDILPHDILLLHHELYKISLLLRYPMLSQYEAHIEASKKYNYALESSKYYRSIGRYR